VTDTDTRDEPLLRVEGLTKHFPVTRGVLSRVVGQVRAVDGVSFDIAPGETLGLVGESGSGKTTIGRCILRLTEPTAGRIVFGGRDVMAASRADLVRVRRELQVIFQDPFSSLNPRLRVVDIVGEALEVHGLSRGADVERRVGALLERVGLSPRWMHRYPHEFSGGQRQRIGVARALALGPKLIVCDEAVSALDVSVQAQVINLLIELRREMGIAYLFIAHDLSVVRHLSHRIAVMYLGRLVELGPSRNLFATPAHPYTRALLSAIPATKPGAPRHRPALHGEIPSPADPPSGCRFHTRCPAVRPKCRDAEPRAAEVQPGHTVHCVHAYDLPGGENWHAELSHRIEEATAENAAAALAATTSAPAAEASESLADWGHAWKGRRDARPSTSPTTGTRASKASPRRAGAAIALTLAVALFLGHLIAENWRRGRARWQVRTLSAEIDARARLVGAFPERLSDLGWRLYPIFPDGVPEDPWGRRLEYRAPAGERRFELTSLGPDGVPSADDLRP
jgi:oligopeptide/dipeptide ABC transporter ATP-binding protein